MSTELETDALLVGFATGVVSAYVLLPAAAWVYLRLDERMRRRAYDKGTEIIDRTFRDQVANLRGPVATVVRSVAIPAVEAATGQPWAVTVHREASAAVVNLVFAALALPTVQE